MIKNEYDMSLLEHIHLMPPQHYVLMQMLNEEKGILTAGSQSGIGKTYLAAILAFVFVTWAKLDSAKVIVIDPTNDFLTYLNDIIDGSPIREVFQKSKELIWIKGIEYHRYIRLLNLDRYEQLMGYFGEQLMGYFGNLLFILDSNGRKYPEWAEEIIQASIASNHCFVYRT